MFDETIVVELKFGKKKIFFTVLYRSPANKHNSPEFLNFLSNFRTLYNNIKKKILIPQFLRVISMLILNYGGPMVILLQKAKKSKILLHCLD